MPIDAQCEKLVSFSEATLLVPRRRMGRKCHVSCIHRWATNGLRGVRLEYVQVGGVRFTSEEALSRFFGALTGGPGISAPAAPPRGPRGKETARILRDAGIA